MKNPDQFANFVEFETFPFFGGNGRSPLIWDQCTTIFAMEPLVLMFQILGILGFSMDFNLSLDGHPSKYWPQPWLLNFNDRTGIG